MFSALIDAGPLIALINRRDRHHEACVHVFAELREPPVTVWPAFTEAMYMLHSSPRAQAGLWDLLELGGVSLAELDANDCSRMRELMWKYRDLPMDLADAALVRVAEREGVRRIFTIDRRDFEVYRPQRLGRFDIVP